VDLFTIFSDGRIDVCAILFGDKERDKWQEEKLRKGKLL
jgi:cAMP phosphodiesterase